MAPEPSSSPTALAGVRVLDIANLFPAPLLAAMLGDLGADVVKVEPPTGDALRKVGIASDGTTTAWALTSRNKRSIVIDTTTTEGLTNLAALTGVADIVVTNQSERLLQTWGCSAVDIAARNPRAIHVSLTAFGTTGPRAGRPGNGTTAEAFSGFAHLNGAVSGPPTLPSLALGDSLAAVSALNAVLAALYWRDAAGGHGQFIDASIFEPLVAVMASSLAAWDTTTAPPIRNGSRIANAAPRNVYRTADDRWVAISGPTDPQVDRILSTIGVTDTTIRARYADAQTRVGPIADELDQLVADWVASHQLHTVERALTEANIPHAAVNSFDDVLRDEHVQHRTTLLPLPDAPRRMFARSFAPLSQTPARPPRPAPTVGEHTEEVLREWLAR